MSDQTFNISVRKGEDRTRLAQLRHSTIAQPLILAADVSTIKVRIMAGIGEGPMVEIEDRFIAPAPGPLNVADVIKDAPITGPGWKFDSIGANFTYKMEWDSLQNDKYDSLRIYREIYEIDCRPAGFSREILIYNVTVLSNPGTITT